MKNLLLGAAVVAICPTPSLSETTEFYRGQIVGVWEACISDGPPTAWLHAVHLISTAVYDSHMNYYGEAEFDSHDNGFSSGSIMAAQNGCTAAARTVIQQLPARY